MSGALIEAVTERTEVTAVSPAEPNGQLEGFCLDLPAAGAKRDDYSLRLAGWVVGAHRRVVSVAVSFEGLELRRAPVELQRPDVAAIHGSAGALSGFDTAIGLASLPRDGRVHLDACLDDGSSEPLAEVGYRRAPLSSNFTPTLQPLIVTSLFRMGTTRLMRLLSEHPEVVAERSYPYETCVASYWLHAYRILTEPANLHESSHPNDFTERQRWIGHNPFHRPPVNDNRAVARWIGGESVEETLAFCQRSADGFYRSVAAGQDEGSPRWFAEKHYPDSLVPDLCHEVYADARKIFLVRDFRDVICSMMAFNAKRGFPSFDRQKVDSDEEMIELFAERCQRMTQTWERRRSTAILVRYEDLVRDPAGTVTAMARHVGLDHSEETVRATIERADRTTPEMSFHRTTNSPVRSIGRWREDLPADTAEWIAVLLRAPLAAFGYEGTGSA